MSTLPLAEVLSFSEEHPVHSVRNLLTGGSGGKWTTNKRSPAKTLEAEFRLAGLCRIEAVDLGNFWSSSVQLEVGLTHRPTAERHTLLFSKLLMTRLDWLQDGKNSQAMRFFRQTDLNPTVAAGEWDRVRVVCSQPFLRGDIFGLAALTLRGRVKDAIPPAIQSKQPQPQQPEVELGPERPPDPAEKMDSRLAAYSSRLASAAASSAPRQNPFVFRGRVRTFLRTVDPQREKGRSELLRRWQQCHGKRLTVEEQELLHEVVREFVRGNQAATEKIAQEHGQRKKKPVPVTSLAMRRRADAALSSSSPSTSGSKRNGRNAFSLLDAASPVAKFDPQTLLQYDKRDLVKLKVLVQTHTYPSERDLPLKARSTTLSVDKGQPVTYYNVGRDVYLFYKGKFYTPAIKDTYLPKLFPNFTTTEIEAARNEIVQLDERPSRLKEQTQCPICSMFFANDKIEEHSSMCGVAGGSGIVKKTLTGRCPICDETMDVKELEKHAVRCAEMMYGS